LAALMLPRRCTAALTTLAFLATVNSAAWAQAPVPPDLVRTKDGGMLRGTIVEKVPNDHVEIQLANGQTRTVKMSDVEYAGPAASDAGSPPPPPPPPLAPSGITVSVPTAKLELKSPQHGLTFHSKVGDARGFASGTMWTSKGAAPTTVEVHAESFGRICTAPCAAEVPQGTYRLGLSLDDGDVVATELPLDLKGKLRLEGEYVSKSGTRTAGWIIGIGGQVVGALLAVNSQQNCDTDIAGLCKTEHPTLGIGLGVLLASTVVGLIMVLQRDQAFVTARSAP
jgi:hypothetical protein